MLHIVLLNECLLHISVSCVLMVFSVCVNVHLLYMLLFKSCFGSSCDFLISCFCFVLQNIFQYFNRMVY